MNNAVERLRSGIAVSIMAVMLCTGTPLSAHISLRHPAYSAFHPGGGDKAPKERRYRGFQNNTGSKYRYSRREGVLIKRSLPGRVLFRMVHPFNRYGHRMK